MYIWLNELKDGGPLGGQGDLDLCDIKIPHDVPSPILC